MRAVADIKRYTRRVAPVAGVKVRDSWAGLPSEALAALEAREFDAVLMDLNYARYYSARSLDCCAHSDDGQHIARNCDDRWSSVEVAWRRCGRARILFPSRGKTRGWSP